MIELIGARNIFADQMGWLAVTEEAAISANPDVILTNVNYIEDSIGEIKSRDGWEEVNALKNNAVYYIDNGYSSLPNHNIVKALKEMALAVYPEAFASLKD
jgi:iron complex transport system substrate-binding protein